MDYKEKYDKAIKRAKAMIKVANNQEEAYNSVITIFPELSESEDERIRKSIIELLNEVHFTFKHYDINKMLAWLEKQDEQKPAWSEEDKQYLEDTLTLLEGNRSVHTYGEVKNWLKSIKERVQPQPKQEWSEEDESNFQNIDSVLFYDKNLPEDTCMRLRNWLKSLKERYTWKPSEEYIHWLKWAINRMPDTEKANEAEAVLEELLEQLKKVMIDLDKFIYDFLSFKPSKEQKNTLPVRGSYYQANAALKYIRFSIDYALKQQGLEYKEGSIKPIESMPEFKEGDILYNKDSYASDSIFIFKGMSDKTNAY